MLNNSKQDEIHAIVKSSSNKCLQVLTIMGIVKSHEWEPKNQQFISIFLKYPRKVSPCWASTYVIVLLTFKHCKFHHWMSFVPKNIYATDMWPTFDIFIMPINPFLSRWLNMYFEAVQRIVLLAFISFTFAVFHIYIVSNWVNFRMGEMSIHPVIFYVVSFSGVHVIIFIVSS